MPAQLGEQYPFSVTFFDATTGLPRNDLTVQISLLDPTGTVNATGTVSPVDQRYIYTPAPGVLNSTGEWACVFTPTVTTNVNPPEWYCCVSVGETWIQNLDASTSSRLATSGYTAPDNTDIGLIKAKTDNLPTDPASNTEVDTRLATSGYTAPDNADIALIKTKTDALPGDPVSTAYLGGVESDIRGDIAAVKVDVDTIPTTPLLSGDTRLSHLDANISSRSTLVKSDILSDSTAFPGADIALIKAKTDTLPSDPASQSALETYGQAHWTTADLTTVLADLSTIDAALDALTVAVQVLSDPWAADVQSPHYSGTSMAAHVLSAILSKASMIVPEIINLVPLTNLPYNELRLVQDTDYTPTSGLEQPMWSDPTWSVFGLLTAESVTFSMVQDGATVVTRFPVTVDDATTLRMPLTRDQTASMVADKLHSYSYQIFATLSSGDEVPLISLGRLYVTGRI